MIRDAEKEKHTLRRVGLIGNVYTHDEALRRKIVSWIQEGNLSRRQDLIASPKNVSRLKTIYPVG